MKVIGFGRTAELVEIDAVHVAKLFNSTIPTDVAELEFENHCAVNERFKKMPFAVELTNIDGKNGIIYQRIHGILLAQYMGKNPFRMNQIVDAFSDLHEEINDIRITQLSRGPELLEKNITRSTKLSEQEKNVCRSFIRTTGKDNVCHGDFHPENVMVDHENRLWVIDWLTAFRGNPLFDTARTYYLLRYGVSPQEKRLIDSIIEGIFRVVYPRRYVKRRLQRRDDRELFPAFLFIVLVLRLHDNIPEENELVEKKIDRLKKRALKIMSCNRREGNVN